MFTFTLDDLGGLPKSMASTVSKYEDCTRKSRFDASVISPDAGSISNFSSEFPDSNENVSASSSELSGSVAVTSRTEPPTANVSGIAVAYPSDWENCGGYVLSGTTSTNTDVTSLLGWGFPLSATIAETSNTELTSGARLKVMLVAIAPVL